MDIAKLSMVVSSVNAMQSTHIGMLKKAMQQTEQVGEMFAEMLQATAVAIPTEGTIDIVV